MKDLFVDPQLKQSLGLAFIFQIGWIAAAGIILLLGGSVNIVLLALLLFLPWIPVVLELLTKTKLPMALQAHFHIFITLSSVAGSTFGMYALVPHWDTFVHIDSAILLAWLGLFAVRQVREDVKAPIPRWFVGWVAFLTPMAFAALWEIAEYTSDGLLNTTTQHGLEDTAVDMLAALVGAILTTAIALWWKVPKSVMPRQ